jgi:transcriptional regulator with XRE-family HTH domain
MSLLSKGHIARAFGEVLRLARRRAEISQERLAEFADIDRTYPSLLERGLCEPTLSIVIRLSKALNINPVVLVKMTLMRVEDVGQLTREERRDRVQE